MTKSVKARRRPDTLGIDEEFSRRWLIGVCLCGRNERRKEGRKEEIKERQKEGRVEQSADQFGF